MKVYVVTKGADDDRGQGYDELVAVCASREKAERIAKEHWEGQVHEFELIEGDD